MYLFTIALIVGSCLDRLDYASEEADKGILVIDGSITDGPGPYKIKLFRVSSSTDILNLAQPAIANQVILYDDAGNSELLLNRTSGLYETHPDGMRGEVGRKYHLRIELLDGSIYESDPDEMKPVMPVDSVYFEWSAQETLNGPTKYGFNVYMDAGGAEQEESYVRWRFTGAYEVNSYPELNWTLCNCCERKGPPDPYPCSGVIYDGVALKQVGPCECCTCWITDYEDKPKLNEDQVTLGDEFKKVKVGYVPFNQWTFLHNKYMVKVEQLSLSREAYEFWKVFKDQKDNASNLFQPALAKAKTNLHAINSNREAIGYFSASAVKQKILFITGADAPISVPQLDIFPPETNCAQWRPCDNVFVNASRTPPPEWQ